MIVAALFLASALQAAPAPAAAAPGPNVIYYRRPGDPPDPEALAAAERLVALMMPQNSLVSIMLPEIMAAAPFPAPPPPGAGPAAQQAYGRAMRAATITEQEMSSAYAQAEPAVRRAIVRYYALTLSAADLEEAARFYGSHAGIRFSVATIALRGTPGVREAMAAAESLLAAARQRIARRIAAERQAPPARPR